MKNGHDIKRAQLHSNAVLRHCQPTNQCVHTYRLVAYCKTHMKLYVQAASGKCIWKLSGSTQNACQRYWVMSVFAMLAALVQMVCTSMLTSSGLVSPGNDVMTKGARCVLSGTLPNVCEYGFLGACAAPVSTAALAHHHMQQCL